MASLAASISAKMRLTSSLCSAGAASDRKGHRLGTMCGGGGDEGGGRGAGGGYSIDKQIVESIDHGGCRRPTTISRPHGVTPRPGSWSRVGLNKKNSGVGIVQGGSGGSCLASIGHPQELYITP
jgi:hypothetical protein